MEEKLRESEEKYEAFYGNAPLSYQSLNEDGSFNDVNPAWLRTLGYDRNEVIGKWFGDFLHPDWKPHFEKNFQEFKRRGYVYTIPMDTDKYGFFFFASCYVIRPMCRTFDQHWN